MTDFLRRLADDRPVLLDGGMSNALEDDGADLSDALWTARILLEAPERVAAVHERYYRAGAEVATTATYQATDPLLLRRGVEVAREVRDRVADETGRGLFVAASVGPYGAVLADGSEYTGYAGRPEVTERALRDFHAPRVEVLAAAGPDVLAVETVPDLDEAEVLVGLLDEVGLPAWVSYAVAGDRTRAGQPLPEAYAALAGSGAVVAPGVNCSAPADAAPAVRAAVAATGLPGVAYPNRGEDWDAEQKRWRGTPGNAADPADWVAAGARLVGGCCRVGPHDVTALGRALYGQGFNYP